MNRLLQGLGNVTHTENGDLAYKSTLNACYDFFAFGGAMRNNSADEITQLFSRAYKEDKVLAVVCLCYLRNCRGGQGERRLFRECLKWLAENDPTMASTVMTFVPQYGRVDDLYCFVDTPLEDKMFDYMVDVTLDLLRQKNPDAHYWFKWLKSENATSKETKRLATKTRKAFNLTPREYRIFLSHGRAGKVVESLMSAKQWDKIDFAKLPSVAGLRYSGCFRKKDETRERYRAFLENKETKVNASVLTPYQVVHEAAKYSYQYEEADSTQRAIVQKYWDNLTDYFQGATLNALCVADTSGSMEGTPMEVAISLALYCAERAGGPFAGNYISFSREAKLVDISQGSFYDKVMKMASANLCEDTNIKSVFDLILKVAQIYGLSQDELPEHIIVVSDMQFNSMVCDSAHIDSTMEVVRKTFTQAGYKMPKLVYWNVNAQRPTFPEMQSNGITYVSGCSPVLFKGILTNKTGQEMMMEILRDKQYDALWEAAMHNI